MKGFRSDGHLTDETLTAAQDSALTTLPADVQSALSHLDECEECLGRYGVLAAESAALTQLLESAAAESLRCELLSALPSSTANGIPGAPEGSHPLFPARWILAVVSAGCCGALISAPRAFFSLPHIVRNLHEWSHILAFVIRSLRGDSGLFWYALQGCALAAVALAFTVLHRIEPPTKQLKH